MLRSAAIRISLALPSLLLAAVTIGLSPAVAAEPSAATPPVQAIRAADFLSSIGVNSAISRRGEILSKTIAAAAYVGLGWIRAGYESDIPLKDLLDLHQQTGVRFSYGLGSGGADISRLLAGARQLAAAGALVAIEGPNEPNNWGVTYQGEAGGGRALSWLAVAKLQRDLYAAVKHDGALKKYPVWSITENGAETDNVGLQFLTIPAGAHCLMPDHTRYADYANVHNYVYHPNSPGIEENKTWNAADPTAACKVDGLYGNYGTTWGRHYPGYSEKALLTLPRVTTETGATIGGDVTEEIHARNLLSLYLDQFKRGWRYTSVYLLRDRVDEAGNQQFGLFRPDDTPRKAAVYLHNLTTILADHASRKHSEKRRYAIPNERDTVHDLLLQKSDGTFELIVWAEKIIGAVDVQVDLGDAPLTTHLYDPTVGTVPIQTYHDTPSLTLTLSDHPQIIEIPTGR